PAVLGQHPFGRNVEDLLGARGIRKRKAAVEPHPTARAAELILMKEVIRREKALLAVNGRFDRHREFCLTGEEVEAEAILAPGRGIAVFEESIDLHRSHVDKRRAISVRIGNWLGDAV